MCVRGVGRPRLSPIEQVWVIATLAQLHKNIEQAHLLHLACAVENIQILGQDLMRKKRERSGHRRVEAIQCGVKRLSTFHSTCGYCVDIESYLRVPLPLHFAEAYIDFSLLLWRQVLLHLGFQAAQEERFKQ